MKVCLKCVLKCTLLLVVLVILVVIGYVLYVCVDYNRIEDNVKLSVNKASSEEAEKKIQTDEGKVPVGQELGITSYNIGFGAYSHDFSFFMDGGKYSRAIDKEHVLDNTEGAINTILYQNADFAFFQEVDTDSTRSYHVNQLEMIQDAFANFESVHAINYHSAYLFYPITEPHGKSNAGISTFSKYRIDSSLRRSFPVPTGFPDKYFDLDRCYSISRIPTNVDGKELVLFNVHMSAYTDDDSIRTNQVKMLVDDMKKEYEAGNYVVCGGDFNHDMIGNSDEVFGNKPGDYSWTTPFPEDLIPEGFTIGLKTLNDEQLKEIVATCRNTDKTYKRGENEVWIVDTFIVSDNVEIINYENIDADFKYSDHNPVKMKFKLLSE